MGGMVAQELAFLLAASHRLMSLSMSVSSRGLLPGGGRLAPLAAVVRPLIGALLHSRLGVWALKVRSSNAITETGGGGVLLHSTPSTPTSPVLLAVSNDPQTLHAQHYYRAHRCERALITRLMRGVFTAEFLASRHPSGPTMKDHYTRHWGERFGEVSGQSLACTHLAAFIVCRCAPAHPVMLC